MLKLEMVSKAVCLLMPKGQNIDVRLTLNLTWQLSNGTIPPTKLYTSRMLKRIITEANTVYVVVNFEDDIQTVYQGIVSSLVTSRSRVYVIS